MAINFDSLVPQLDGEIFDTTITSVEPDIKTPEESEEPQEEDDDIVPIMDTEEEPQEEEKNKDNKESTTSPEELEVSTLFYTELVNRGIAESKDGKTSYSWDDVDSVLNNYTKDLPEKVVEDLIESSPDIGKNLIDFVFSKGSNLTKQELKDFYNEYLQDLEILESDYSFEDSEKARDFLFKEYKAQGFRDSQIEVLLDTLEDESEDALKAEAKKYADKKKENLKSTQTLNQVKENSVQEKENLKQFAEKISSELVNTGWKSSRVNKIKEDLFSGRTNEIISKAAKNPAALIQLANLATYFDEKTGSFNFTDFILQSTSKETKTLRDKIKKDMFTSSNNNSRGVQANPNRSKFSDLIPISPLE